MNQNGVKLVCFEFCGEKFAFNMDDLVEIVQIQSTEITPFFSRIPLLRGKWNYREQTIDVIDLRDFFDLEQSLGASSILTVVEEPQGEGSEAIQPEEKKFAEDSRLEHPSKTMLVVKIREQLFGLLTDAVVQVVPLGVFYEYPGMISTLPKRYFAGITTIKAELVLNLAIDEFINASEIESLGTIDS